MVWTTLGSRTAKEQNRTSLIIMTCFWSPKRIVSLRVLKKFIFATTRPIINLMTVTVERYLKVVHPFWSKKNLKRWMIYTALAFSWICGTLTIAPVVFVSTVVEDGLCLAMYAWESPAVSEIISVWVLISYFVIPLVLFVYCYRRIVLVMRRQIRVMAAHNAEGSAQMSASQIQSKRVKWNIVTHTHTHTHARTHTHTHPFNGPFSGTTQVSRYQKGKTNLDFTEARDSEWQ